MQTPDGKLDIDVEVIMSDGTGDNSNPWSASVVASLRDAERDASVYFDIGAGAPTEAEARRKCAALLRDVIASLSKIDLEAAT